MIGNVRDLSEPVVKADDNPGTLDLESALFATTLWLLKVVCCEYSATGFPQSLSEQNLGDTQPPFSFPAVCVTHTSSHKPPTCSLIRIGRHQPHVWLWSRPLGVRVGTTMVKKTDLIPVHTRNSWTVK